MKPRRDRVFLLVVGMIVVALCVAIIEAGYRAFLYTNLNFNAVGAHQDDPNPNLKIIGLPNPEPYNPKYGFDYASGALTLEIRDGNPAAECNRYVAANERGNLGSIRNDYVSADIKIWLFGSSFTMMTDQGGQRGNFIQHLLNEGLEKRTGQTAHVINFSRAAYGLVQMMDMVNFKLAKYPRDQWPQFIVFAVNTSDVIRSRHWRWIREVEDGWYHWVWAAKPRHEAADTSNFPHNEIVLSRHLTDSMCAIATALAEAPDKVTAEERTRLRSFVGKAIDIHNRAMLSRAKPRIIIDFFDPGVSFAYNQIRYDNPFQDMVVLDQSTPGGPIQIARFDEDAKFVESINRLRDSGVPFHIVHIPYAYEMAADVDINFDRVAKRFGYSADAMKTLFRSLQTVTGEPIIGLLPVMNAPVVNAYDLVDETLHWNPRGAVYIAGILEELFVKRFIEK